MPWWGWLLLVWPVAALALGVIVGRAIRLADRRQAAGAEPTVEQPSPQPDLGTPTERPAAAPADRRPRGA
jgi:hypothetical protein